MPIPTLSEEQRKAATQKALESRKKRASLRAGLHDGKVTLAEVLSSEEEYVRKTRVSQLLSALPGFGKVKVAKTMEELGIAESRRVGGLGSNQRRALIELADGK